MKGQKGVVKFQIAVSPKAFGHILRVYIDLRNEGGGFALAGPLIFKEIGMGEMVPEPTMQVETFELQGLMDELWKAGIRPSSGEGNVGQIGAIEKHLNDMRKLVEKNLDIKL
jgi:hypothetical protein